MKIGIIAEDVSDVAVIKELTLSLLRPNNVGFNRFVGDGCGKLRRKCAAWAEVLVRTGCTWIVVVHDLDDNNEAELRRVLSDAVKSGRPSESVVLIPKREMEAWLLYDAAAIATAFREVKHPKLPGDPESLQDPKQYLTDLVLKTYSKRYLNTIHNPVIAKQIRVFALEASKSFAPHPPFVTKLKSVLEKHRNSTRKRKKPR